LHLLAKLGHKTNQKVAYYFISGIFLTTFQRKPIEEFSVYPSGLLDLYSGEQKSAPHVYQCINTILKMKITLHSAIRVKYVLFWVQNKNEV